MKIKILFVFVLLIQIINAFSISCPPNSKLKPLGGSTCYNPVPTCKDPTPKYVTHPQGACTLDLVSACWCDDGYLMQDSSCVLKENCPK